MNLNYIVLFVRANETGSLLYRSSTIYLFPLFFLSVLFWYETNWQTKSLHYMRRLSIILSYSYIFFHFVIHIYPEITNKIHNDIRVYAAYFNLDTSNQTTDTIKHQEVPDHRWIVRVTFTLHTCLRWKSTYASPHWSTGHSGLFPSFPSVKAVIRSETIRSVWIRSLFRFVATSSPSFPFTSLLFLSFPHTPFRSMVQVTRNE